MNNFNEQFIIIIDASKNGLGSVLIQKDENNIEKLIHFVSRTLKPAENNYGITDLEGTAAAYCVNLNHTFRELYEPGKRNVLADVLSRLKTSNSENVATYLKEIN
eukprot:jgi/Orpsp1_1/1187512/evm.model.d7180000058278.1